MNMINKLKNIYQYLSLMGFDWFIFRIKYEILKTINYFDRVNKSILVKVTNVNKKLFHYKRLGLINQNFKADSSFIAKADNAITGKIYAFSNAYLDYRHNGKIDWQMSPVSKVKADDRLSWNNLPDFGEYGDIKLIWEASRFPQVYYFINAYSLTQDQKYADSCISQIMDWIESNPFPLGVNYKCGQEISFRIFAWIHALEYFKDFLSKDDEAIIVKNIYTSLLRIEANIEYAAKSVKNNHSISEAAGLFIGGLLFTQFDEAKRFIKKGKSYLLEEMAYQVYKDGAYIQHSFTYERLALDVLSFVMLVSRKKSYDLPVKITKNHYKMISFLYAFVQENGKLPNYGSNDGANLFAVSSDDYRDFRNSLNLAMAVNNGEYLFDEHKELISFFDITAQKKTVLSKETRFDDGGYYILKNKNLFTFIRCHSYVDRPAQNDMFHFDVWYKDKNLFCDAGSYSYNTDKTFKNNFTGAIGHNTLLINQSNPMIPVLNFGWSNWTQAELVEYTENTFRGRNYGYKKRYGIVYDRAILLEENTIVILDTIVQKNNSVDMVQLWQTKYNVDILNLYSVQVDDCILTSNYPILLDKTYISEYYNSYTEGTRIIIKVPNGSSEAIKTTLEFKQCD